MLTRSMSSFYIHVYCSVITLVAIIVVYNIINVLLYARSMAVKNETDKNRPPIQRNSNGNTAVSPMNILREANIQSIDCKDWIHITEVIRKDPEPIRSVDTLDPCPSPEWWRPVNATQSIHLRGFTDGSTEGRGIMKFCAKPQLSPAAEPLVETRGRNGKMGVCCRGRRMRTILLVWHQPTLLPISHFVPPDKDDGGCPVLPNPLYWMDANAWLNRTPTVRSIDVVVW